jgi:hypothetical protein
MVVAVHRSASSEGVLVELAGFSRPAKASKVSGEVASNAQGIGMVIAEPPLVSDKCVLVKTAGLFDLTELAQVDREMVDKS